MVHHADIDRSLARVRDFVARATKQGVTVSALAEAADIDNKSVAQALQENWNPTANTLRRLEALLPKGWQIGDELPGELPRRRRRASGEKEAPASAPGAGFQPKAA